MSLPAPEALEIFTTEFACDVLRLRLFVVSHAAFQEWSHSCDFVLSQISPVFAVHVALLAVVVLQEGILVSFHVLLRLEAHLAVRVSAFDAQLGAGILLFGHGGDRYMCILSTSIDQNQDAASDLRCFLDSCVVMLSCEETKVME